MHVEEPSEEETLEILKGLRPLYEKHHGVTISDEALEAAVKLSVRYINAVSYTHLDVYKRQDPSRAYFGCHTDITIPYEELGSIEVIRADGSRIPVISGGRFVVPGTEALNESLDEAGK